MGPDMEVFLNFIDDMPPEGFEICKGKNIETLPGDEW